MQVKGRKPPFRGLFEFICTVGDEVVEAKLQKEHTFGHGSKWPQNQALQGAEALRKCCQDRIHLILARSTQ